jgi:hypothetical protein
MRPLNEGKSLGLSTTELTSLRREGWTRLRTFRYEVGRWQEGRIPDVAYAVASHSA